MKEELVSLEGPIGKNKKSMTWAGQAKAWANTTRLVQEVQGKTKKASMDVHQKVGGLGVGKTSKDHQRHISITKGKKKRKVQELHGSSLEDKKNV